MTEVEKVNKWENKWFFLLMIIMKKYLNENIVRKSILKVKANARV